MDSLLPLALATVVAGCSDPSDAPRPTPGTRYPTPSTSAGSRDTNMDAGVDSAVASVDGSLPGPEAGARDVVTLFDGTLTGWRMSTIRNQPGRNDPGHFSVEGGALVAYPGTDIGVLWSTQPTPPNFVLDLEWRLSSADDNSGIFLRFPDLETKGYDNTAWVAVHFGFEVQINEPGYPDGAPEHTTGAIYGQPDQTFRRVVANAPGEWNAYSIRVQGDEYTVRLNGHEVTRYVGRVPGRGSASTKDAPAYIGLQTHTGNVAFRKIQLRPLVP